MDRASDMLTGDMKAFVIRGLFRISLYRLTPNCVELVPILVTSVDEADMMDEIVLQLSSANSTRNVMECMVALK